MKKIILTASIVIVAITLYVSQCMSPAVPSANYTNVIVQNASKQDSVLVYLTIQAPNSVIGIFGITDTIGSCSKGTFWAHNDTTYQSNLTGQLLGAVLSFGGDNLPCQVAIPAGFPTGINIFEFSINTPFEVFDISCEDGMNSMLKVSASDSINWATGDGSQIAVFDSAKNVFPIQNNINVRGVFPYRCTDCKDLGTSVPQNCLGLKDTCSTYRTCQVARTNNNGGIILVQYLGGVPQICK